MSRQRVDAAIVNRVMKLIHSNTNIKELAVKTITAAATAHNSKGKKSLFGFGKDLERQSINDFESVAEHYLDALEKTGEFDSISKDLITYYALVETLSGNWNHPQMASSRMFLSWLETQGMLKNPLFKEIQKKSGG